VAAVKDVVSANNTAGTLLFIVSVLVSLLAAACARGNSLPHEQNVPNVDDTVCYHVGPGFECGLAGARSKCILHNLDVVAIDGSVAVSVAGPRTRYFDWIKA
jgi:hypothetical protein